jgi:hypothetical protein
MKTRYNIRLRRQDTGEVHDRLMIADGEAVAKERAVERARNVLPTMADRQYARFEVLSCEVAGNPDQEPR